MDSDPHHRLDAQAAPSDAVARSRLRLMLKPRAPATGHLDGGWWPRSRDLVAELPGLAEVPALQLGAVTRVSFALADRNPAPLGVQTAGRRIRLEGPRPRYQDIVLVSSPGRRPIRLSAVPLDSPGPAAHGAWFGRPFPAAPPARPTSWRPARSRLRHRTACSAMPHRPTAVRRRGLGAARSARLPRIAADASPAAVRAPAGLGTVQ